jgi:hypothetical protein
MKNRLTSQEADRNVRGMFFAAGTRTLAGIAPLSAVPAAFSAAAADGLRVPCGGTTPHAPRFAALVRS